MRKFKENYACKLFESNMRTQKNMVTQKYQKSQNATPHFAPLGQRITRISRINFVEHEILRSNS